MPGTDFQVRAPADPGLSLEKMKEFVRNHFEDFVNRADFLDHDEPTEVEVGPEAAKRMMEAA